MIAARQFGLTPEVEENDMSEDATKDQCQAEVCPELQTTAIVLS